MVINIKYVVWCFTRISMCFCVQENVLQAGSWTLVAAIASWEVLSLTTTLAISAGYVWDSYDYWYSQWRHSVTTQEFSRFPHKSEMWTLWKTLS